MPQLPPKGGHRRTNRSPGYHKGDNLVICDRSGKVYRASDTRKEWTGLVVGKDQWEPRHPQEYVKARPDRQAARIQRPDAERRSDLPNALSSATFAVGAYTDSYASGSLGETRPLRLFTLDLGAIYKVHSIALTGLSLSDIGEKSMREGLYIEHGHTEGEWVRQVEYIGKANGGVTSGNYRENIMYPVRYVSLVVTGGKGTGYSGEVLLDSLTVQINNIAAEGWSWDNLVLWEPDQLWT